MTAIDPPASPRCQIYGLSSVRCINTGTHWVSWGGKGCGCGGDVCMADDCEQDFSSWECDGPHRFGETTSAAIPRQREAA
jgi:hypothetical protein